MPSLSDGRCKGFSWKNGSYSYGLYDEFAVLAYWSGHFKKCSIYAQRMLEESYLPEAERPRVLANLRFARTKLVIDP